MEQRERRTSGARQGGFSLLEVVIAGSILIVIVGIAARTLAGGNALLGAVSREVSGDVVAQHLVQQIADRIRNGIIDDTEHGYQWWTPAPYSPALTDGQWAWYGLRVRHIKSFKGGIEKGKTVWLALLNSDPYSPTNPYPFSLDNVDNDKDGLVDEQQLRIREYPGDDDDPGATPVDQGMLADNLGLIWVFSAPAGEPVNTFDPRGQWDPSDTTYLKRIYPGLHVVRNGDSLTITVGVLRRDPQNLGKNGLPTIRCFMGKTTVTMRN